MTAWVAVALSVATGCAGIVIGICRERYRWSKARPGYLLGPQGGEVHTDPLDWDFPARPPFDQEADEPVERTTPLNAALGNPLIPDPTLIPALDATVRALDPHSRKVPDGDIRMAERRYETWLENLKDHPA